MTRAPVRGRPYDVLRYVDYVLDPKRSMVVDLNGGVAETYRGLREAMAGLYAAEGRLAVARAEYAGLDSIVRGMEGLEALGDERRRP